MRFATTTVKGFGRGKTLGFPTINMKLPEDGPLAEGIYACWANVNGEKHMGALFYGPIPVFGQKELALEVYLLDVSDITVSEDSPIEIEIVEFIHPVMTFENLVLLKEQIAKDVAKIREILAL